ncbi:MAG: CPBP family intramembrane metalloprotease [Deltaproteobacteria bacterium]|nr:CPBP family intramembrane metalloprotease [Deltaproteobacteria bacterium]MCW5804226.1 CPBP family intramembrane metalloprotease [Deltaproteobacteria bacterium]
MPISKTNAGRDAILAWAGVAVLVTLLVRINVTLPAIGHLGSAFVAVLFLYVPVGMAWHRTRRGSGGAAGETLDDYGFHVAPVRRGLVTAAVAMVAIFPLFVAGYIAFYEIACNSSLLAHLVPRGMCGRYGGLDAIHAPKLSLDLLEFCAVQLVVVALPEELFFRGFLLGLLEQRFPPKRRILGGGVGLALVLSAIAFGLIHLPKDGDPRAFATMVPGLLFGWMRSATGSILASTLTHAGSNILIRFLELSVLR